jgi:hypothetical protein
VDREVDQRNSMVELGFGGEQFFAQLFEILVVLARRKRQVAADRQVRAIQQRQTFTKFHQPVATVLKDTEHVTREFAAAPANDERVINGPGVDVPCISLNRWPDPEYHTTDDNPSIIHEDMLQGAADVAEQDPDLCQQLRPQAYVQGSGFLSGHGLWVDWREDWALNRAIEKIMVRSKATGRVRHWRRLELDYWSCGVC